MEINLTLFLDQSGFLRRECPTCEREFKLFYGQTATRPDNFLEPENYTCPYCGVPSSPETWWTPAQLEYATSASLGPLTRYIEGQLDRTFGRGGFTFKPSSAAANPLPPPIEPDDMLMVEPPCHPFEPIKVIDSWDQALHCLMCGSRFKI